jgi:hypothetical protein
VAVECCKASTPCILQGGLLDDDDIQSGLLRGPMVATIYSVMCHLRAIPNEMDFTSSVYLILDLTVNL